MILLVIAFWIAWPCFWCWACVETANRKGWDPEWWGIGGFLLGPFVFIAALIKRAAPQSAAGLYADDPADSLVKLAALHTSGAVTDEEFAAKKRELLERI